MLLISGIRNTKEAKLRLTQRPPNTYRKRNGLALLTKFDRR